MAGNVDAAGKPDLFVTFGVLNKPFKRSHTGRAANQAAMQADGKHFWRFGTFGVQHVESVLQVLEKLPAADQKALKDEMKAKHDKTQGVMIRTGYLVDWMRTAKLEPRQLVALTSRRYQCRARLNSKCLSKISTAP